MNECRWITITPEAVRANLINANLIADLGGVLDAEADLSAIVPSATAIPTPLGGSMRDLVVNVTDHGQGGRNAGTEVQAATS